MIVPAPLLPRQEASAPFGARALLGAVGREGSSTDSARPGFAAFVAPSFTWPKATNPQGFDLFGGPRVESSLTPMAGNAVARVIRGGSYIQVIGSNADLVVAMMQGVSLTEGYPRHYREHHAMGIQLSEPSPF